MTITVAAQAPLAVEMIGGVRRITLNDPASRNALSEGMLRALSTELEATASTRSVRVVVLAASGPVFCAGHHLKELTARRADSDRGRAYFTQIMTLCAKVMQQIVHMPQPVIAEVQGTATAAGCQLVATCDLALAAETVHFATPGVNIGLFCSTPMVALSRNVSRKQAMAMLLTGEMIDAQEAERIGLINQVVPAADLTTRTMALAQKIASKSTLTVKTGKEAFYRQAEMPLEQAYAYAAQVMVDNMLARDAEEGIGAFIDKREPRWEDR